MWRERDVRKKRCQENLKCLGLLGLLCWNQRSAGEPRHAVCLAARPAPSGRVFPAVLQERALLETSPARCCACSTCSQTMQMQKCKRHVMTKCFNFRQYASCILFARRWPDGGKDTGSCPVLVWRMASTCGGAFQDVGSWSSGRTRRFVRCLWPAVAGHWQDAHVLRQNARWPIHYQNLVHF